MTEYCIDASIAVKWAVVGKPFRSKALALLRDAGIRGIRLIAPHIFASEADGAIQKRVFDGRMTTTDALKAYTILDAAPVELVHLSGVRERAREIAAQFQQHFVYDATYAALAEMRNCEFWTADQVFYDAVKAVLTSVKYLPDYP